MYDDFYGLSDKPFQLTPDPRFYFESATHRKAMAYLGYGLAQGEGFIVITGEIGAGKTTLVAHLMATVDPARVAAINIVSTQVEGDDMLRLAANGLGIDPTGADKALLLSKIDMTLQDRAKAGQRTLLIVDEAQNLPTSALEELRMLSNFQSGASAMVQILLLGQPEFRDRLNSAPELEQLRQRVIATHHLTAMESDEIGPYLAHRLKLVGWNGRPQFTEEAISGMEAYSGGLPRKLNTLASRVLLLGAVERLEVIDDETVKAVVADLARDTLADVQPVDAAQVHDDDLRRFAETAPVATAAEPVMPTVPTPYSTPVAEVSPVAPAWSREPEPAPVYAPEPAYVPEPVAPVASFEQAPAPAMNGYAPQMEQPEPAMDAHALDVAARVAMLEAQVEEQDAALRRVLSLLVEWVEKDGVVPAQQHQPQMWHAPAA